MYRLTLSEDDQRAIDWIGGRYEHGHDLYRFLCECEWEGDHDWGDGDLTVLLTEPQAWELRDKYEDCEFTCTPDLGMKILEFIATIV